jgi:transmembrane sensor
MKEERLQALLEKDEKGILTPEESHELDLFYDHFESRSDYTHKLSFQEKIQLKERLYRQVRHTGGSYRWNSFGPSWVPLVAASLIFAILGVSIWANLFRTPGLTPADTHTGLTKIAVQPGKNQARLTLADGTVWILDTSHSTILIHEDGIRYEHGDYLADQQGHPENGINERSQILQMDVPYGGIYTVVLSDGTKVWLNSGSQLRYPTRFEGEERKVELTGEGYFEVSHVDNPKGKRIPFFIQSGLQTIEVLGTKFNVQAYPEERTIKTTLLEGAVKVNSTLLHPGEQAVFDVKNREIIKKQIDPRSELAWKNGYFHFDNENLRSIMKKISRWYDVEVDFQLDPDQIALIGIIPRSERIESILNSLEKTGEVRFKIDERRITVMK